jgi:hypothetical protein|tara:strand:+ start:3197 stop:3685 length:489 start_codon:yes stop_codon:yes gene_type:complete
MKIRTLRPTFITVAAAATFFSSAVFADDTKEVRLPLGTVQMTKTFSSPELTLSVDTEELTFESSYFPEVEAFSGNSFLIFLASGERDCLGRYIWATLDEAGLRASPPFGSCSDRGDVKRTAQGLMLVMPDQKSSGTVSFILNRDGTVTEFIEDPNADSIVSQ